MNEFGEKFYELMEKYRNQQLLQKENVLPSFVCYKDNFPADLLKQIESLSKEKSKYVSKKNQNGDIRDANAVVANVFKGVIAETVAHIFLMEVCGFSSDEVKRFDLERGDFVYNPHKEYDVALFSNGKFDREIGVKSSKIGDKEFKKFLQEQHCIIGKYRYNGRADDHDSSFYLGIVIVFEDLYDENQFINNYLNGKVHTYIVSGATFSEMTGEYCTNNIHMKQKNTVYNLGLRSYYAGDAEDCKTKLLKVTNGKKIIDYEYSRDAEKRIKAYVILSNRLGLFHTNRNCKYIKNRDDVIGYSSITEVCNSGCNRLCSYCRELENNMKEV